MNGTAGSRFALVALTLLLGCEERVVEPADVARVELQPEVLTLRVGGTSRFEATVFDDAGNALTGRTVAWSIEDGAIGAVAENGTVIATAIGQTRIVARAGGQEGSATLRVTSNTVASVEVVPAEAAVEFGATRNFDVVVKATDGTTLPDRTPTWSSDASNVATVDDAGTVKGVGLGSTTITAMVDGVAGDASVSIVAPPLTGLEIQPATASVQVGDQQQLTAVGRKEDGTGVPGLPVAWRSLDPNIATVSSAGVVTAVAEGEARIEAGFSRFIATATVAVTPVPAAAIDVEPNSLAILVNDTVRLSSTVRSADGSVLNREPQWSSSAPGIASVSSTGLVRGLDSGFTYVVAALDGARDSALVRVAFRPIAAVVVLPSESTVEIGETVQLTAQVISDDGSQQTRETTWESADPNVATVNGSGLVTAVARGTAVIRATAGGVSGTGVVNVAPEPIASLEVTPPSATLEVGTTTTFTATGRNADGEVVPGIGVSWRSSNTAVATVNASGTVTAVAAGSAQIIASAQGLEDAAEVTVTSNAPASIDIDGGNFSLEVGTTRELSATVRNASGQTVDVDVDWSSKDSGVASVNGEGVVKGEREGTTYIRASAGALRDSVAVTVTRAAVARVEVSPSLPIVRENHSIKLTATVYDAEGNELDRPVKWSTSEKKIATVEADGTVTGRKAGVAVITATVEGKSDSALVTVIPGEDPEQL